MSRNYKPSEIDKVVTEELDAFANACTEDIHEAAVAAAKWANKELKAKSPGQGDYHTEWRVEKQKLRTGTKTTVYNKKLYMLSHLLEHGHAKVNGGRTRALEFIAPINDQAAKKFENELKRRVENGS